MSLVIRDAVNVKYIDHMGDDESIIAAARQSTDGEFRGWGTADAPGDEKLLRYMWEHGHHSVFEFCQLHVEIECPMDTRTQIMRHRTFSYSERSGRYVILPSEVYVPIFKRQATKNRQASGEVLSNEEDRAAFGVYTRAAEHCLAAYEALLDMGVSKEQARRLLPVGWMTKFRMCGDLRCWLAFLKLRDHADAQDEAQYVAKAVAGILREKFPRTCEIALGPAPT